MNRGKERKGWMGDGGEGGIVYYGWMVDVWRDGWRRGEMNGG